MAQICSSLGFRVAKLTDDNGDGSYDAVEQSWNGAAWVAASGGMTWTNNLYELNLKIGIPDNTLVLATIRSADNPRWIFDGTVSIVESGTAAGQMLFWDASSGKWVHTETAKLIWDDTNDRVGIGTATPAARLTIGNSDTAPPLNITERSAAPSAPATGDIYLDNGSNTGSGNPGWRRYTGAAWEDISPAAALDYKVKVSADDTTPDYLFDKIDTQTPTPIKITASAGGNESLYVDFDINNLSAETINGDDLLVLRQNSTGDHYKIKFTDLFTQITVITAAQLDASNNLQIKTRTAYVAAPGTESAWTTVSGWTTDACE
jgi:hypothetical protein